MTLSNRKPTAPPILPALLGLVTVAWLAGCASTSPAQLDHPGEVESGGPDAAPSTLEPGPWNVTEAVQAELTGAGQQAVVVLKVPDDLDHCPFPGYDFRVPAGTTRLRAWLNTSATRGWMSMELYSTSESHFPEGTTEVQGIPVHLEMSDGVIIEATEPETGAWQVGLKPEGTFTGSFTLTLAVEGNGKPASSLGLQMTC